MKSRFWSIVEKLIPNWERMGSTKRKAQIQNIMAFLLAFPLGLWGVIWLITITDLTLLLSRGPLFLLLLIVLVVFFKQQDFFIFLKIRSESFSRFGGSLESIITWSAVLLFGPTAIWLGLLWELLALARNWFTRRQQARFSQNFKNVWWERARNLSLSISTRTFAGLVALSIYRRWGGRFPLIGLNTTTAGLAFYATVIRLLLSGLLWGPFFLLPCCTKEFPFRDSLKEYGKFMFVSLGWAVLVDPFGILAAGIYSQMGLGAYIFFVAGLLLTSSLARLWSHAARQSYVRSQELERLDKLGCELLNAPPNGSTLSTILQKHIPNMFPGTSVEMRVFPDQFTLNSGDIAGLVSEAAWEWLKTETTARYFKPGANLPWGGTWNGPAFIMAPIVEPEFAKVIAGLCFVQTEFDIHEPFENSLPATQALASRLASALQSVRVYHQTLEHQRVTHELVLAGKIQSSFLPSVLPEVPGWELTAILQPALQTSGDFYDFISLSDGNLGILIADVADKGTGAALYMALSRTLLRTYALEYETEPEVVLSAANCRILADTQADLFVTVFYGILDLETGQFTYANAGHNPPYVFNTLSGGVPQPLDRTGLPLGIFAGKTWERQQVFLEPGDVLLLYTDGIPDAENAQHAYFGLDHMLEVVEANLTHPAKEIQSILISEVEDFVGAAPQADDVTLIVVTRDQTGVTGNIELPASISCAQT
ncbi:MAG: PP2C family protein-serine/threonine phosphatase [Anaerolineae bacterium]|nr:PP2C family protein-serine/threonine phosphatase [Anaerolineae bacterium]